MRSFDFFSKRVYINHQAEIDRMAAKIKADPPLRWPVAGWSVQDYGITGGYTFEVNGVIVARSSERFCPSASIIPTDPELAAYVRRVVDAWRVYCENERQAWLTERDRESDAKSAAEEAIANAAVAGFLQGQGGGYDIP